MKPPLVIGGVPGSGTRVVARIAERAGYFLGTNRTGAEDAVEFWELYDRWINRYLLRDQVPLCAEETCLMKADLARCIRRHRAVIPSAESLWGWKNPRSLLLLPFLNEQLPEMRFIHLIRDGRDMAFSDNQYDVERHGPVMLRDSYQGLVAPVRAATVWAKSNGLAFEFGTHFMPRRYLMIKYELLCTETLQVVAKICAFIGAPQADAARIASDLVVVPTTIGRWRAPQNETVGRVVETHIGEALAQFGYR